MELCRAQSVTRALSDSFPQQQCEIYPSEMCGSSCEGISAVKEQPQQERAEGRAAGGGLLLDVQHYHGSLFVMNEEKY